MHGCEWLGPMNVETNLYTNLLDDLERRVQALRGYL
jgi:hypothetical protein